MGYALRAVFCLAGGIAFFVVGSIKSDAGLVGAGTALVFIAGMNFELWGER
jgi:hypothetical protein